MTGAVNFIFGQLMSRGLGDGLYRREALVPGASYPPKETPDAAVHIIDLSRSDVADAEQDADVLEARHRRLHRRKDRLGRGRDRGRGRPARPPTGISAFLLRSANVHAAPYARELQLHGIPAWCDTPGAFFGTPEVATAPVRLLRVIDNPCRISRCFRCS